MLSTSFRQPLQWNYLLVVLVLPFPWTQPVTPRGGHCRMGSPASRYLPAQALPQTGEGTPAFLQDSSRTRKEAVYWFYAPTDWRKKERQGSRPTVGEALATSLGSYRPSKLGSPQPVRCRPIIACLLYLVRRA